MGNVTVIGLLLDIAGVCFLSMALALVSNQRFKVRSGTYWDANRVEIREMCATRIDARAGLLLLLAGFSCQIAGYFGASLPDTAIIILSGTVIALLGGLIAGRGRWADLSAERIFEEMQTDP